MKLPPHPKSLPSFSTDEELEKLLVEGLNSGEPTEVTPEFWNKLRMELLNRHPVVRKAS